jgi:hypothetical protein
MDARGTVSRIALIECHLTWDVILPVRRLLRNSRGGIFSHLLDQEHLLVAVEVAAISASAGEVGPRSI